MKTQEKFRYTQDISMKISNAQKFTCKYIVWESPMHTEKRKWHTFTENIFILGVNLFFFCSSHLSLCRFRGCGICSARLLQISRYDKKLNVHHVAGTKPANYDVFVWKTGPCIYIKYFSVVKQRNIHVIQMSR